MMRSPKLSFPERSLIFGSFNLVRYLHTFSRCSLSWFVIFSFLNCAQSLGQEYYGIKIDADNVVFLLDVSGSMEDKDEGIAGSETASRVVGEAGGRLGGKLGSVLTNRAQSELTKLGAARRELIRALNGLESESQFTIFRFGEGIAEWPGGFKKVGSLTRRLAQGYVAQLSAQGGTPMSAAIEAAFSIENVEVIFLVSDGLPTDGSASSILGKLPSLDRGRNVVINTIGIGPDQDEGLLCDLARHTGGFYVKDNKISCHGGVCDDPETRSFFNTGPSSNFHQYNTELTICSRKNPCCTVKNVFNIMTSQMRFVAPTLDTSPVTNCKATTLPGNNPVRTVINESSYAVENYTKAGHVFHPGRIVRTVAEVEGKVVVRTYGEGNGDWGWWNANIFNGTWPGIVDPQIWVQDLLSSCSKK